MPLFELLQQQSFCNVRTKILSLDSQAEIKTRKVSFPGVSPGRGQTNLNDCRVYQPRSVKIAIGMLRPTISIGVKKIDPRLIQ